jgi:hypothetical protein
MKVLRAIYQAVVEVAALLILLVAMWLMGHPCGPGNPLKFERILCIGLVLVLGVGWIFWFGFDE